MADLTPQAAATTDRPARTRRRAGDDQGRPPRRTDHGLPWLAVLAVVVAASIPMLMGLPDAQVVDPGEARAIAASVQTWRELDVLPADANPLMPPTPRYNGEPMYERPPALTWLHLVALAPLDRQEATLEDAIFQARLVSVAFGLLMVAAVFWAGLSIGGMTTAVLASLVCAAIPVVLASSRLATAAMPQAGAAIFAFAAALWAVRPFKPSASLLRQAVGWTMCGVALGAAVLLGGVGIAAPLLVSMVVVLLICPGRVSNVLALAAACCIAALMLAPWAIHVHGQSPDAWRSWFGQVVAQPWTGPLTFVATLGERVGWFLLGTLPWTLWLVGGLIQPLSTSSAGSRQRMFVGWGWFTALATVLILLPPGQAEQRVELLLLLAATAVLIGQVFRQYADLSDQGRHVRYWSIVRFPQLALMLTLSAGIPMVLAFQDDLVHDGWLSAAPVAPMSGLFWLGLAAALVGIAGLSMRYALQHHPGRTAACWAVWVLTAAAVCAIAWSRGPVLQSAVPAEARELAAEVGDRTITYLGPEAQANPILLLYSGLTVRHLTQEQVDSFAGRGESFYILTPAGRSPNASASASADGDAWRSVRTLPASGQHLWHTRASADLEPAPDTETDTP